MDQYCCRLDETELLPMSDLGGGLYQCPRCTSLRMFQNGFARVIGHEEANELLKQQNAGCPVGGIVLGGLLLLMLGAASS